MKQVKILVAKSQKYETECVLKDTSESESRFYCQAGTQNASEREREREREREDCGKKGGEKLGSERQEKRQRRCHRLKEAESGVGMTEDSRK